MMEFDDGWFGTLKMEMEISREIGEEVGDIDVFPCCFALVFFRVFI